MYAVVNQLTFSEPVDPALFAGARADLEAPMRKIDGFVDFSIIQASDTEVLLLILAMTPEVLDRVATEVGSPWMVEHVVPLLAQPPRRQVGPVVATTAYR